MTTTDKRVSSISHRYYLLLNKKQCVTTLRSIFEKRSATMGTYNCSFRSDTRNARYVFLIKFRARIFAISFVSTKLIIAFAICDKQEELLRLIFRFYFVIEIKYSVILLTGGFWFLIVCCVDLV